MNILIIRLSAIGDIVMASPLIDALQARYPSAKISWLVQPESAALLKDHPRLAQVIVWDRQAWRALRQQHKYRELFKAIGQFRRDLRAYEFELVLDCQGLLKSGIWAWLSGAPRRIGLGSREGSQWLMTENIARGGDQDQIGSEYRFLADHLDCDVSRFPMHLAVAAKAGQQADQLLAGSEQVAVISPFTTRPQKHWFADAWVALAAQLTSRGYRVVMLGGPGDVAAANEIASQADLLNLVGETDLQTAVAIIAKASLQVGVDTGLTHMGIAKKIPVVALFGSTRPYLQTDNQRAKVIYHDLSCAPCKRSPTCAGAYTCMREITADEVMEQVERVTA